MWTKSKIALTALMTGALMFLVTGTAFAQEATGGDADVVENMINAAKNGQWLVLAGLALIPLIWLVRKLLAMKVAWVKTDAGGMVVAFGTAAITTVAAALAEGMSLGTGLIVASISAGLIAVGGWSGVMKNLPWFNKSE